MLFYIHFLVFIRDCYVGNLDLTIVVKSKCKIYTFIFLYIVFIKGICCKCLCNGIKPYILCAVCALLIDSVKFFIHI